MKIFIIILFLSISTSTYAEKVKFLQLGSMPKMEQEKNPPEFIRGEIFFPKEKKEKYPIVLFLHATSGLEYSSRMMRNIFVNNEIAFLEIDLFGSRNKKPGFKNRLKFTRNYLPDVWGALDLISNDPRFDKSKIAIVGQSLGGILALNVALGLHPWMFSYDWNNKMPKAVVAWYPVCSGFNSNISLFKKLISKSEIKNVPLKNTIIIAPELDAYEKDAKECNRLYKNLFAKEDLNVWNVKNATHKFDGDPKDKSVKNFDPRQFEFGRLKSRSDPGLHIHDFELAEEYRKKTVNYVLNIFKN